MVFNYLTFYFYYKINYIKQYNAYYAHCTQQLFYLYVNHVLNQYVPSVKYYRIIIPYFLNLKHSSSIA